MIKTLHFHCQGWVQSLVRELRSHCLAKKKGVSCGMVKLELDLVERLRLGLISWKWKNKEIRWICLYRDWFNKIFKTGP